MTTEEQIPLHPGSLHVIDGHLHHHEEHVPLHPGGLHVVDGHAHHFEPIKPDISVAWQTISEFTAGAVGGIACVLAGQPFDTVKVKMQTYPEFYRNSWHCFRTTFTDERVRGIYKGTVPALAANIAENSILFMSYGLCKTLVCKLSGHASADDLTSLDNAAAGSAAAFFSSLGLCPTELVKCRMQAMHEILASHGKADIKRVSAWNITKTIIKEDGFKGLFKGLTSTWAREMPGYFFFFGGYEISRTMLTPKGQSKDDLSVPRVVFSGGLAGAFFWAAVYPIDVVKSRIQVQSMLGTVEGFMPTLLKIYHTEGMRALYSGFAPCVLRSFPSNGALLVAFEWARRELMKL